MDFIQTLNGQFHLSSFSDALHTFLTEKHEYYDENNQITEIGTEFINMSLTHSDLFHRHENIVIMTDILKCNNQSVVAQYIFDIQAYSIGTMQHPSISW